MDPMEDSLTLEGAMSSMDFDHSDVVVNQEDITLEESESPATRDIQMGLEHVEEHPTLMEATPQVVVSDFMNQDQFSFQEYTIQNDSDSSASNPKQSGSLINIQHVMSSTPSSNAPNFIPIKPALQARSVKKGQAPSTMPRQVAIAPRPPNTPANVQYASVPPKPISLIVNQNNTMPNKKLVGTMVQGGAKGNTVIAQIGKQLVVMPTNTAQKIKLVNANPGAGEPNVQYAQMVPNKGSKLVVTKLVQGDANTERSSQQPFQNVIPNQIVSKMFAPNAPKARYVMHQKTVPISIAGTTAKVVLSSPTKQTIKVMGKKQFITINTQNTKMVPKVVKNVPTSRVIITKNPSQNVIIRANTPKASTQSTPSTGQRTQLHPINVPGKGIQYIKLVTNANQPVAKPVTTVPKLVPAKNFVLTDGKGNIIQMGGDKTVENQSTPLLLSTPVTAAKGTMKTSKKFVRIAAAPVGTKPRPKLSTQPVRSSQSLLVPQTTSSVAPVPLPEPDNTAEAGLEEYKYTERDADELRLHQDMAPEQTLHTEHEEDKLEQKPSLQVLIAGAVGNEMDENTNDMNVEEEEYVVEIKPDINKEQNLEYILGDTNAGGESESMAQHEVATHAQPGDTEESLYEEDSSLMESRHDMTVMNVETEVVAYTSPTSPPGYSDADYGMASDELGVRPRKACNCTKSQCLKLYCDCFANGEFCNNCNCNNCHNNLENEELRQKAIRACLERNPNAFRPKIGKGKTTGADLIRRHNKGCNCKRSGCLKNYCECYEAKIACTSMCKCVGCRNVEETLERRRDALRRSDTLRDSFRPPAPHHVKQPCSFMTLEVIEAVCQCLLAAASDTHGDTHADTHDDTLGDKEPDPVQDVIEEFARCLQDIISASHQAL